MKIKLIVLIALVFSLMACENQEITKDDFGSTSVYFPYQTPVRTLVLGKYDLGFNDNDNNGRFEIGVVMSGVFENNRDRRVFFELAPQIIDSTQLVGVDSVNVQVLPASYYTIEQQSPVTIPAGSINGRISIQLNDAFFDDPLSFAEFGEVNYVIPLRITGFEELDSLLTGVPLVDNPIRIRSSDWAVTPKDYTLFGIKFMNKYQGIYLRRGSDKIVGVSEEFSAFPAPGTTVSNVIDTTSIYKAEFIEWDEIVPVSTSGRNSVTVTNRVRRGNIPGNDNITLNLVFDDSGNITITNDPGSKFTVTGTGKFVEDGDEWGGIKRDVMYLEYEYSDVEIIEESFFGTVFSRSTVDLYHTVKDTLVIRDRDVKFEEFTIGIKAPAEEDGGN